ncbi:MAG: UDP-N-acetylmuramoyl-L-alanyl-D-glutamate--2,6-diaminopimelate ligase [Pseudobdellovibrio sp.]
MKLQQLFTLFNLNANELNPVLDHQVQGLFFDARQVTPNSVFVAIKGSQDDGHKFIEQAILAGAIALVVENKSKVPDYFKGLVVVVPNSRLALDQLAANFYNYPSNELFCFGITGTNGKTSITYILEHILNTYHKAMAVMGTVNHRIQDHLWASQMTTPDPVTLQKRLRDFRDHQALAVAIEITSHALDQKRADSVNFNTAIFTNLTLDHLDYHQTMQHYFHAKQRLFTDLMWASNKKPLFAIVNIDDSYGRKLQVAEPVIVWTYGQKESDFQFKILEMTYSETKFELKTTSDTIQVVIPISGLHMIYNCVASIAAALSFGISVEQSIAALKTFAGVPGRLQKVISDSEKTVFVDYAHTPDALQNVLNALNEIRSQAKNKNKIITVFGCGGDRDKSKRPLMAEIAAKNSDYIFITSDNPRTENPEVIAAEIKSGVPASYTHFEVEVDREKAIAAAIHRADAGDVILIAGKGHEDYQIVGTQKIHFSDFEVARKYL